MEDTILLVDDDEYMLEILDHVLKSAGYKEIVKINDSREVESRLAGTGVRCMILDLSLPYKSGEVVLAETASSHPEIPVLVLTSTLDSSTIVRCIQAGAVDYLTKPVETERFLASVNNLMTISRLRYENKILRDQLISVDDNPSSFASFVTGDPHLRSLFSYAEKVSRTSFPFLVTGETGTGKELIARAIHDASGRKGKYIAVNVSGLDDTILSDTLFGHVKGAYTSAESSRKGLIREAEDGTLFLDEIGDISMQSQVKLLRLIQSGEYYPLGSDICLRTNARIVAATNRNLPELIEQGTFRNDLYYRLRTHWIDITPLRKRKRDIRILFDHFLMQASQKMNRPVPEYSIELINLLSRYDFPGNGREMEGMIYDAVAAAENNTLSIDIFRSKVADLMDESILRNESADAILNIDETAFPTIHEMEEILIRKAIEISGGNQSTAAIMLGISRQTLNAKLRKNK